MINNITLKKLNNSIFGADIGKIEVYIKYFNKSKLVSDTRVYEYEYENLRQLLKEIKPESSLFLGGDSEVMSIKDEYDFNTKLYINNNIAIADRPESDTAENIKQSLYEATDFVCIPYVTGINVKCTYINGYLYRIYLCNKADNLYDVTKILKSRVPNYIDNLADYRLCELIGKVTIFNNNKEEQKHLGNILCSAMMFISDNINIDKLDLIFTDIIFDEKNSEVDNMWDMLEYLRTLHINVVHHALLRDIDNTSFSESLNSFKDYFDDIEKSTGIIYPYNGYEIKEIKDLTYNNCRRFIYDTDFAENNIYESKIKSFTTLNDNDRNYVVANVIGISHDDKLINKVIIEDLCRIDNDELHIGSKIRFKVINDKAYIY